MSFITVFLVLLAFGAVVGWVVGTHLAKHGDEKAPFNLPDINLNCGGCLNLIFYLVCFFIMGVAFFFIASAVF